MLLLNLSSVVVVEYKASFGGVKQEGNIIPTIRYLTYIKIAFCMQILFFAL